MVNVRIGDEPKVKYRRVENAYKYVKFAMRCKREGLVIVGSLFAIPVASKIWNKIKRLYVVCNNAMRICGV